MSSSVPSSLPSAHAGSEAVPLPRLSATSVRGVPVHVECPSWCVTDHAAEDLAFLEDVHHYGPAVGVTVPVFGGGTETVLVAHLALWPADGKGVYVVVNIDGSAFERGRSCAPEGRDAPLLLQDAAILQSSRMRCERSRI